MAQWVKGPCHASLMTWSMKPTGGERQPQSCSQTCACTLLHTWHPHTHTQTWRHTHTWLHTSHRHADMTTHMHTYICMTTHTYSCAMYMHTNNNNNNNKYLKWIHGNYKIIVYFKRVKKLMNLYGFLVSPFHYLFYWIKLQHIQAQGLKYIQN